MHNYTYDIKTETLPSGRTYFTPDGNFPSITTILGKTSNQAWLQAWKDKIGEEEAARISKEAMDRGTLIHSYAEKFFNEEDIYGDLASESSDVIQMTKDLISLVKGGVTNIWGQELVLWSKNLQFAGRTDMVGEWKGIPAIIDFKTSRKKKYINQIKDYFLQCAGYVYAHNELYNTNIKKIVIAITVENNEPQIFETNAVVHIPDLKYRIKQFYKLNWKK